MLRIPLFALLLAWCGLSQAAPRCAFFEASEAFTAMVVEESVSHPDGGYVVWDCYSNVYDNVTEAPRPTRHCLEGQIDLRRLGDRAETVRAAANPVAAFFASLKRHATTWESPRCKAIMARIRAEEI